MYTLYEIYICIMKSQKSSKYILKIFHIFEEGFV